MITTRRHSRNYFPADQSITEMWERVQTAFFEQRLKWQDP
jgi:hypothetical protein